MSFVIAAVAGLLYYVTAAGLVNELIEAQDEHRPPHLLKAALKQHLIVLDELGFIPFSPLGAQLLFQFCSSLNERVALIVTTNLIRRLGAGLWRRALDGRAVGSPYPQGPHPGICRGVVSISSADAAGSAEEEGARENATLPARIGALLTAW